MFTKRIAIVSVVNDLVTDNRVLRAAEVLQECGYEILLVGRRVPGSLPLPAWSYRALRMKLLFLNGPLFYLFFNLRLFIFLLFSRAHLLYSNDLDTLLPNFLVSRIRGIPLIYDSHELFCEVPELQHSPVKKRIWEALEKAIVPRLRFCITVNQSIASVFFKRYGVKFHVVRNIGAVTRLADKKSRQQLSLPEDRHVILLQGAGINIDRGAEELVEAMTYVDNAVLLIIGSGDVWPSLVEKVKNLSLESKVRLIKKIPRHELVHYTANADLGLSIDKNTNLNYFYSLPNKLFDYIHSGLPVLASRLPEIERLVTEYRLGEFIESHDPPHIAERIRRMLDSGKLGEYHNNCLRASLELNWENEREILKNLIRSVEGKMYF